MATIRRLSDEDVKAVFDCVHNNRPPPSDLPFYLVNVGPNGLKLSPPSYEFEGTITVRSSDGTTTCCLGNIVPGILKPALTRSLFPSFSIFLFRWSLCSSQAHKEEGEEG